MVERLVSEIIRKKNPCIIGLDPQWEMLPECYKIGKEKQEALWDWSKDVLDAISDVVAAVKIQIAFYEQYGSRGFEVFEKVVSYAQERGLLVIDDCKRNDIGNTAEAYAYAHLAKGGPIDADFVTINPFLGMDSMKPFIDAAQKYDKGLFVLTRTSNEGAKDFQKNISEEIAYQLAEISKRELGKSGYCNIGAVVGATNPEITGKLRKIMKRNFFLVPGFGTQGGNPETVLDCFQEDGLGALISSSRQMLYTYDCYETFEGTSQSYKEHVKANCEAMRQEVYMVLKAKYKNLKY